MYRPMHRIIIPAFIALGVAAFSAPAAAEPEADAAAETEEGPSDEEFAKGLIGRDYEGSLELKDWVDYGGGLVSPPIYVNHYQRENGTSLVVTAKETPRGGFVVIDAFIISKPWKGYVISIACTKGKDFTLRFIGDARGPDSKEWWSEVRRAWEIAVVPQAEPEDEANAETASEAETVAKAETESEPKVQPGKITKTNTRGVKCTNPNW